MTQQKLIDGYKKLERRVGQEPGLRDLQTLVRSTYPRKAQSPCLYFSQDVHITRAYLFAFICGENNGTISCEKFLAGCRRFGLDSPCPIICKRLHCYGNTEEIEKDFKRVLKTYQMKYPTNHAFKEFDPDVHHPMDFRGERSEEKIGFKE